MNWIRSKIMTPNGWLTTLAALCLLGWAVMVGVVLALVRIISYTFV